MEEREPRTPVLGRVVATGAVRPEPSLNDLQVGVIVQGPRAEVLYANPMALELLDVTAEEILGRTSIDGGGLTIHEDGSSFPGADHPGPRALATGRPVRNVVMGFLRPRARDRVWLLVNADPRPVGAGLVHVVVTMTDISVQRRLEERLRESEARYRQLVERAQDIIYRTDIEGFFTYVNPMGARVMNYLPEELVGKHFLELIREDHRTRVESRLIAQYRGRTASSHDLFAGITKDGREVWIEQNVQLLCEGDQVLGFQAVARDVTERRRAEEALEQERQQLRQIVTNAPVAMAIVDREGRFLAHSQKWLSYFHLGEGHILGRRHEDVIPELPRRYEAGLRRALAGEVVAQPEDLFTRADGGEFHVRWTLQPWRQPGGEVAGVVAVVQTIDVLVRARQAALDASRLKSEFLGAVSQELRGPLGTMVAAAEALLKQPLAAGQRDQAQSVDRAGRELLGRLDDIEDYSLAEGGRLELETTEFDLVALLQQVVPAFSEQARSRGLGFVCEITSEMAGLWRGDPVRLLQILGHLIGNAFKFTAEGEVRLRLGLAGAGSGAAVRFEVVDTGIGIAHEAQERIFQAFSEVEGQTGRRSGTGLGLALCRRLAEAMGGEIGLMSEAGEGSTFWVTLPLLRPESDEEAEASGGKRMRVLVVEDNAINQRVAVALLKSLDYDYKVVENGVDAVQECENGTYDAVLMDCQMPEMDGYKATAWIRAREGSGRRTTIIALTASGSTGDRERCLAAGMDDYLAKPVRRDQLAAALHKWVRPLGEAPASGTPRPGPRLYALPVDHPLRALEAQGLASVAGEIIDLFLESAPLRLQELRALDREADSDALRAIAHSLRGASVQMGLRGLADLLVRLDAAVAQRQPTDGIFDALDAEFEMGRLSLHDARRRLGASGPQA
jgi:PAS domain S-box-containing protein